MSVSVRATSGWQRAQRLVMNILRIQPKYRGQRANEESWPESLLLPGLRWEVKFGAQIPKWLTEAISQVEAGRPGMSSLFKPAVAIVPSDYSTPYAVVALEDLVNVGLAWQEVGRGPQIVGALDRAVAEITRARKLAKGTT